MYGGWSWWWLVPMMVCAALLLAIIVGALIAVLRAGVVPHRRTPEDQLDERLARGEIDSTEYHERLDALHQRGSMTSR
jgi:uncharacterized membrane protein